MCLPQNISFLPKQYHLKVLENVNQYTKLKTMNWNGKNILDAMSKLIARILYLSVGVFVFKLSTLRWQFLTISFVVERTLNP